MKTTDKKADFIELRAKAEGESVNNLVHSILEEALKEE